MRPQRFDCSAIIPHHCAIARQYRTSFGFGWRLSGEAFTACTGLAPLPGTPKSASAWAAVVPRKFCEIPSIHTHGGCQGISCLRTAAAVMPMRRIMSKIASGRFRSKLLTATYRNKPVKQMANM